jgi:integrase
LPRAIALTEIIAKTVKLKAGDRQEVKGKILEFAWHLKKNGFAESTIKRYIQSCNTLTSYGANILDPESVKETIAKQKWQDGTKLNYVDFYETFIKFLGLKWQKPKYKHSRKLPFIPLESEIDLLIHGTGKKISTALQIIKETGMRIEEVMRLRWIDIDMERNIIALNYAEKHGNNRMFRVSTQLIQRILMIPKKSEWVFNQSKTSVTSNCYMARKRIAYAYNNPRLLRISFHTLRHWKATIEYHKTKDILHVKNMLGHQSIDNTLIYITLEQTLFGSIDNLEFHVKVAHNLEAACELIKVGFDYVCELENCKIFRKRK